jgi:hypothetical protein
MLAFLRTTERTSARKLRLYGVACCRRIWSLLEDERSRAAILVAEQYADGLVAEWERAEAETAAAEAASRLSSDRWFTALAAKMIAAERPPVLLVTRYTPVQNMLRPDQEERKQREQSHLLRDIFGPVPIGVGAIDPAWLRWNDEVVVGLARAIYEERAWERLPILADALEEAGCTNGLILTHLRGQGPHVRGCWPVDLFLSRG